MIVRVVLATFAVWASLNGIASAQVKLRLIQPYSAGTPIDLGATALVSSLEKRLSGTATIELIRVQMPAQEVAGILATGQADMGLLPSTFIASTTSSSLSLFDLPFLFKTLSEVAAVQDRYVGEALLSSVGPNMVGISYWNGGMTNVFGRVLSKPSDLREAKLFTTVSPEGALAAEALGAATSRLAPGEAIAAFRSGALNTAELSPTAALRLAIAPTYISDESYRPLVSVLVSSERSWNQLPFRVQTVLATEARNVAASVTSEAVRQDAVANRALSEKGSKLVRMEVTSPDEVERAWRSVPSVESTGYLNATLPLLKELRETPPNRQRGDTSPGPGVREILFATDRVDEGGNDPALRFGSARGPLRYGVARFALDPSRRVAGPGLGTSLASIDLLDEEGFTRRLRAAGGSAATLLFVHGYYNGFVDAALTAALLADDLKLSGTPMMFSWPSAGAAPSYAADEDEVRLSRDNFERVLKTLATVRSDLKLNVLAHSMGSRLVVASLEHLYDNSAANVPSLSNLIFAAPDVYTAEFRLRADALKKSARRVTLYASEHDGALACSSLIHRNSRAGQAGDEMLVIAGIDTVDTSPAERAPGWLTRLRCTGSHSYVMRNNAVQNDLHSLTSFDAAPDQRHGLQRVNRGGTPYWRLDAGSR